MLKKKKKPVVFLLHVHFEHLNLAIYAKEGKVVC